MTYHTIDHTIGQIIAAQDAHIRRHGGWRADYDVTTRALTLIEVLPSGEGERAISSASVLPHGEIDYSEEVANALLGAAIGRPAAEAYPLTITWCAS